MFELRTSRLSASSAPTGAILRPRVTFDGGTSEETIRELHHKAHECCFISNSVNFPVEVEPQGLG